MSIPIISQEKTTERVSFKPEVSLDLSWRIECPCLYIKAYVDKEPEFNPTLPSFCSGCGEITSGNVLAPPDLKQEPSIYARNDAILTNQRMAAELLGVKR